MTFATIVSEIAARLNITSTDATTRIGRLLNIHYRDLTASLGLDVTRRTKVSANTSVGSNEVTFASIEHIESIIDERTEPYQILKQVTHDELRTMNPEGNDSDDPRYWAVKSVTATGITIVLDMTAESIYALKADGLGTNADLSGSDAPAFPQSYHFILIELGLYDEYMKMEKADLAKLSMSRAEKGISDLRMFFAKSAYLDIQQGKLKQGRIRSRFVEL